MIYSVIEVVNMLFNILELAIIIDCIVSWIPQMQDNKYISLIHNFVYPMLEPFKRLQDRLLPGSPLDFSPIIAIFILEFFKGIF